MVEQFDPDLVFVNLGDVDRVGHSDLTGTTLKAARTAALASTNAQIGRFVDLLKSSGRWSSAMVIVLADHSMDWSVPQNTISLTRSSRSTPRWRATSRSPRTEAPTSSTGPARRRRGPPPSRGCGRWPWPRTGVFQAHVIDQTPSLQLGANAGDLLVYCKAGWRFSDPGPQSNPIPGTTGTRPRSPSRSSWAADHPWCARESRGLRRPTRWTSLLRSASSSASAPRPGWEGYARL